MHYKQNEIQEHIKIFIQDIEYQIETNLMKKYNDVTQLHYDIFVNDCYLIDYIDCRQWLKDKKHYCIKIIKDYENINYGKICINQDCIIAIVNTYVYIIGEQLLYKMESELIKKNIVKKKIRT